MLYPLLTVLDPAVVGTQSFGQEQVSVYDSATGLPANGNNMVVTISQNLNGVTTEFDITVSGLTSPVYTGMLRDTATGYYTSFAILSYVEGAGIPPDPTTDDLDLITIDTTPQSVIGANDGTAAIAATSSFGPIQYSLDNVHFQTSNFFTGLEYGLYTAYITDDNGGAESRTFTVGLTGNILQNGPGINLGGSNISNWNAAFNPIFFNYVRKDFEVNAVANDGSGNLLVAINGDMTGVTVPVTYTSEIPGVPAITTAGDSVYLQTALYNGTYQVLSSPNAGQLILGNLPNTMLPQPFTANDTIGFININSLRPNYSVQTIINYVDPISGKFNAITLTNRPNSAGIIQADMSSFLKALLQVKDFSDYTQINYRDMQLSASYQISYAEIWTGKTPVWTNITRPYYVTFAARQLGDLYGGNLAQFVPFLLGFQPAQWLTDFVNPVFNPGFPFDLGFIFSEYMVGLAPFYTIILLDINKNPLFDQSVNDSYLLNQDGGYQLNQDSSKFIIASQQLAGAPITEQVGLNRLLIDFALPSNCWYFIVQLFYKQSAATINFSLSEGPPYIDGNLQILFNGIAAVTYVNNVTGTIPMQAGTAYTFIASSIIVPVFENARIRLTVTKDGVTIFDNSKVQDGVTNMEYTGIAQPGSVYTMAVSTYQSADPIPATPIDITDDTPVVGLATYALTQPLTCRVDKETPDRSVYLRWIGLTGSWNYYRFCYNQAISLDVTDMVTIKNFVTDWANTDTLEDVISKNAGKKMTVWAENVPVSDIEGMVSLKAGCKAQILTNAVPPKWQTVIVPPASYTESETMIDFYSLSLTFNFPGLNLQYQ